MTTFIRFDWLTILTFLKPFIKMALILIIGHFIIVLIKKIIKKALNKTHLDTSFTSFIEKALNIILHILIILSALNSIGISTTGLLAAMSAAAVAVAVSLKDSLSNVAGGILLLISPRFSTGDFIEAGGNLGTVLSVDLLHTTIRTPDNKQISIPNGVLINSYITNYSRESTRRVDITFSIAYENDPDQALRVIKETISNHPLVLSEPAEPFVRVSGYGESAVNIITRTWCNSSDYVVVLHDITELVRTALEENNISFPYNQLDVHIKNN